MPVARAPDGPRGTSSSSPAVEVDHADPQRRMAAHVASRGRRRSCAPRRRPSPGTPTAHSRPREPGRRGACGRARAGSPPPPARTARRLDARCAAKRSPSTTTRPAKPASATSRFEPCPTTSTGDAAARDRARRTSSRSPSSSIVNEQRGRAADPVGGQRAERHVASGAAGPGSPRRIVDRAAHRRAARRQARRCSTSGSVVRSPAPRVRHRSPGRSSARQVGDEVGACGSQATRRQGWASSTASTTSLPVTPGRAASPAG